MVNELICATLGCGPVELAKDYPDSDVTYGNGFWDRPWCKLDEGEQLVSGAENVDVRYSITQEDES